MTTFNDAMAKLLNAVYDDYDEWAESCKAFRYNTEGDNADVSHIDEMKHEFEKGIDYTIGRKYAKITTARSVWGFVVAVKDDKKFRYGDILMAASWNAPARNHARGNIFEDYSVKWTGPHYL